MNKSVQSLLSVMALAVIAYVGEHFYQEYGRASSLDLSCSSDAVLGNLKEISTRDLKKAADNEGYTLIANIPKNTITTESRVSTGQGRHKYTCNATVNAEIVKDTHRLSGGRDVDYTVTENDAGTHFWVSAQPLTINDLSAN